jgi:hypothetical protein
MGPFVLERLVFLAIGGEGPDEGGRPAGISPAIACVLD